MADVSDRDRGQLFLVGALIIATLLVVLALFLNSGIYAQNLSARNADPGVQGANQYRNAAVEATAETMDRLNREDPVNASYTDLEDGIENGMGRWSNGTASHGAYQGQARETTVTGVERGTLVRQNTTGTFTNRSGNTSVDWTVVDDTGGGVRQFRLDVTDGNLADDDDQSDAFRMNITEDGTDRYLVYLMEDGSDLNVTVDGPAGEGSCEIGFDAGRATVDVTNASVAGTACPALDVLSPTSDYRIRYENPARVEGTYELIVAQDESTVNDGDLNDPGVDSPWAAEAVYSAEVDVFFRARSVAYRTTIRIAPGEPS